jgi:hypothetical protein
MAQENRPVTQSDLRLKSIGYTNLIFTRPAPYGKLKIQKFHAIYGFSLQGNLR